MLDTTRDPFLVWLSQNLPPGITVTPINDWLIYHLGRGEVHCSSNETRVIPSASNWWDQSP